MTKIEQIVELAMLLPELASLVNPDKAGDPDSSKVTIRQAFEFLMDQAVAESRKAQLC